MNTNDVSDHSISYIAMLIFVIFHYVGDISELHFNLAKREGNA